MSSPAVKQDAMPFADVKVKLDDYQAAKTLVHKPVPTEKKKVFFCPNFMS